MLSFLKQRRGSWGWKTLDGGCNCITTIPGGGDTILPGSWAGSITDTYSDPSLKWQELQTPVLKCAMCEGPRLLWDKRSTIRTSQFFHPQEATVWASSFDQGSRRKRIVLSLSSLNFPDLNCTYPVADLDCLPTQSQDHSLPLPHPHPTPAHLAVQSLAYSNSLGWLLNHNSGFLMKTRSIVRQPLKPSDDLWKTSDTRGGGLPPRVICLPPPA